MKIVVAADLHGDPRTVFNTRPALEHLAEYCEVYKPDFALFAGDLFDRRDHLDPTTLHWVKNGVIRIATATASTILLVGNHDAANDWGKIDNIKAAFEGFDNHKLRVSSMPQIIVVENELGEKLLVGLLPAPVKYHYLAGMSPEDIAAAKIDMRDAIADIARGIAFNANTLDPDGVVPKILVYHGMVDGVQLENEHVLGPGQTLSVPRSILENDIWDLIVAGDIHKPQEVGRVIYTGSMTQLTHAQEGFEPSFMEIEIDSGKVVAIDGSKTAKVTWKRIPIPVQHEFATVDIGADDIPVGFNVTDYVADLVKARVHEIKAVRAPGVGGDPILRIRAAIFEERFNEWDSERLKTIVEGVEKWRFEIERIPPTRIRGEDITFETNIGTLFDNWIKLNPGLAEDPDGLRAVMANIEVELKERGLEIHPSGARPIATGWKDFLSLSEGSTTWDELGRLNLVTGENGTGKTNFSRTKDWALYGKAALPKGIALKDIPRIGTKLATCFHEFEDRDGGVWKVVRTVKRSTSGAATSELLLWKLNPNEETLLGSVDPENPVDNRVWVSANQANQLETQAKINEIAGSPDIYFQTHVARQREIELPLNMTPVEMKDFLQEILGSGLFQHRFEIAHQVGLDQRRELDKVTSSLNIFEGLVGDQDPDRLNNEIIDLRKDQDGQTGDISTAVEAREAQDKIVDAVLERVHEMEAQGKEWADHQVALQTLEGRQKTLLTQEAEARLNCSEEAQAAVKEELEALADMEKHDETLDGLKAKDDILSNRINELGESMRLRKKDHSDQMVAFQKDIEDERREVEKLGEVPCQKLPEIQMKPEEADNFDEIAPSMDGAVLDIGKVCGDCRFIKDATHARDVLPAKEKALSELLQGEGSVAEDLKDEIEELIIERREVGYTAKDHTDLREKIRGVRRGDLAGRATKITAATASLRTISLGLEGVHKEIEAWAAKEPKPINGADLAALKSDIETEGKTREGIVEREANLRQVAITTGEAIARTEGKLGELEKTLVKRDELLGDRDTITERIRSIEAYEKAVGRDGIPFLLLERALPSIQKRINELLESAPIKITIEPIRDLSTGGIREGVWIYFIDDNGTHPLAIASGYQKDALGISMRGALAEFMAETTGSKVWAFAIDEAWGSHHENNHEAARLQLSKLADRFERVVYVTHVPEMADIADTRIQIKASADGAIMEVER